MKDNILVLTFVGCASVASYYYGLSQGKLQFWNAISACQAKEGYVTSMNAIGMTFCILENRK